jgi:hypothetical protein
VLSRPFHFSLGLTFAFRQVGGLPRQFLLAGGAFRLMLRRRVGQRVFVRLSFGGELTTLCVGRINLSLDFLKLAFGLFQPSIGGLQNAARACDCLGRHAATPLPSSLSRSACRNSRRATVEIRVSCVSSASASSFKRCRSFVETRKLIEASKSSLSAIAKTSRKHAAYLSAAWARQTMLAMHAARLRGKPASQKNRRPRLAFADRQLRPATNNMQNRQAPIFTKQELSRPTVRQAFTDQNQAAQSLRRLSPRSPKNSRIRERQKVRNPFGNQASHPKNLTGFQIFSARPYLGRSNKIRLKDVSAE